MREGISCTRREWPEADIMISAQLRLEDFYASLGFRSEGAAYVEDGIDHVEMRLDHRTPSSNTMKEKRP